MFFYLTSLLQFPASKYGLSHSTALFVRGGVPGLRRVMPKVTDRLPAGMEINELTAEVMTVLMEPLNFLSARGYLCTTGCERSNAARGTVRKSR